MLKSFAFSKNTINTYNINFLPLTVLLSSRRCVGDVDDFSFNLTGDVFLAATGLVFTVGEILVPDIQGSSNFGTCLFCNFGTTIRGVKNEYPYKLHDISLPDIKI